MSHEPILYTNHVGRDELYSIETPSGTDTWTPIPHILVVERLEQRLNSLGWGVVAEGYSLKGSKGEDMWGTMRINRIVNDVLNRDLGEFGFSVGFKNSNRQLHKLVFGAGGHVTVCSNGMFIAETIVGHKHSKFLMDALNPLIDEALGKLIGLEDQLTQRVEHYKTVQMSRTERNDFIVTAFEQGIVPGRSMGELFKEIANPRHKEFRNDNLWGIYNCVTETLKKSLNQLQSRTLELTKLSDDMYGFQPTLSA